MERVEALKPSTLLKLLWGGFSALLLFWAIRLWGHFPATMDTLEYVFPEKWFNVESYRHGHIPLWNPYIACGTPHVASFQPAVFYPPFWLWNLTGLSDWFTVMALLHGLWAALGFYLWLRVSGVSPIPSTLCGLSFGGSALVVNYWGFPTHLATIAWTPWVFWGTVRLTQTRSLFRWALLALFWSFQILAGYAFFTFYTALFLGVWMWARHTRSFKTHLLHGSAFLGALLLTACQWFPFVDFMGYLHREVWGDNLFSLRWVNYLTLLQPGLLGIPGTTDYKGDYPNFIFNNLYLGLVPLGIFLWSLVSPYSKDHFWKAAAFFWLFWLAGVNFPLWKVLPGVLLDRLEPAKASFLFLFCALTAVALSLEEKARATPKKSPLWRWAWVLGALWALDLLTVPTRLVHPVLDPYRNPWVQQAADKARQMTGEGRIVSLRDPNQYYSKGVMGLDDSFRETALELIPNTNVIWGLKSARGYLTVYTDGFQNLDQYLRHGYPYEGRVLDAAGVDLILFPQTLPAFKYGSFEPFGPTVFTRNAGALPNAWEVSSAHEFSNRPEVFNALLDPKAFLENEVYTQKGPDGKGICLPPTGRSLSGYPGPSLYDRLAAWGRELFQAETRIQNSRPSPCEAVFQIATSHQGFLVFDESFSPGWHAWMDGEPKPIFRVDGLFMAVPLPDTGAHQVVFRYEPTAFRLGLFLTLFFLVMGAMGMAWKWKRDLQGWTSNP